MTKYFLISIGFLILAQILTFFQLQSQFIWSWAKENPIIMSLLGIPTSYFFIMFTSYCVRYFDGLIWPGRLIGFSIGIVIFATLAYLVFNEGISVKTFVCLLLSMIILVIQLFWK